MALNPNNKSAVSETSPTGLFHTAPDALHQKEAISFVVGGDLGGQNYCKRVDLGYPMFSVIKALSPDFFILTGTRFMWMVNANPKAQMMLPGGITYQETFQAYRIKA